MLSFKAEKGAEKPGLVGNGLVGLGLGSDSWSMASCIKCKFKKIYDWNIWKQGRILKRFLNIQHSLWRINDRNSFITWQDSPRQDSLEHRLSYLEPDFERSWAQNGLKTHWSTSACALASLSVGNTIYWKFLYFWKFKPIRIISVQISHIFMC